MSFVTKIKEKFNNIDYLIVTASTVFCSGMTFLFSIIARHYIEPALTGIYASCILLETYLAYAQFGVLNAYNRDMPQFMGAKRDDDALNLRNSSISFIWLSYLIVCIIASIVVSIMYALGMIESKFYFGYLLAFIYLIIDTTATFCMNTARIYGKFNFSAWVNIAKTLIAFFIGILGVKYFGYYGLYVMPIAAGVFAVIFYYRTCFEGFKIGIDFELLKEEIKTGFPLMVNNLVWTLVGSVDKFVILIFMSTVALGIYDVPQMVFTAMVLIPQTISQVFYYKVSYAYGKTNDKSVLINMCNKYTNVMGLITGAVAVIGFYVMPVFVKLIMPKYVDGIFPAQILLIGVAIYGSTMLYGNIFSVMKWNKDLIINSIILCIFNVVFSTTLVLLLGREINNVAFGTAISYAAYSFLLLARLSKKFDTSIVGLLMAGWGPLLLTVVPAILLYILLPNIFVGFAIAMILLCVEAIYFYKRDRK